MKRLWLILFSIFGLILTFNLVKELLRFPQARQRLKEAERQLEQVKLKNLQLKQEKQLFLTSEHLEREIRNKLMMGKRNEAMVILPEEVLNQAASLSADQTEVLTELPVWRQWWELFK